MGQLLECADKGLTALRGPGCVILRSTTRLLTAWDAGVLPWTGRNGIRALEKSSLATCCAAQVSHATAFRQ